MNKQDLVNLLNGEKVIIKQDDELIGAIQLDLEFDVFLALVYQGKNWLGEDDYFLIDVYETIEEAMEQIKEFKDNE